MKPTSALFSQDELLTVIAKSFQQALIHEETPESKRNVFSNLDCLMSGLAVFVFKYASLLQFDHGIKSNATLLGNLKRLFSLKALPSDTQMRERLDRLNPEVLRLAFRKVFALLQRSKVLDNFLFMGERYLISLDGTGVFSSQQVHCEHCCEKQHRDGSLTYYHQILAAALVHPDQKVVFPLAPEPIMKADGFKKNDCERNAAKRWVEGFRREHPHLKAVLLADGLSSTEPFITLLRKHHLSFILVCKESDHAYLTEWIRDMDDEDSVVLYQQDPKTGAERRYVYSENVPLSDGKYDCKVNVVRFGESVRGKTTQWMWVTDLALERGQLPAFVKGARSRWKIENETFNTLKNQGYEFEHNYGHGQRNLNFIFSLLMMLAFLMDQCLQKVNRLYQQALEKARIKKVLWQDMLSTIKLCEVPDFETLYHAIADPPKFVLASVR